MCDNVIYTMKKGLVLDTKTRKILPRSPLVYARMYRGRCDQRVMMTGDSSSTDRPRCWQLDNSWISNIQES